MIQGRQIRPMRLALVLAAAVTLAGSGAAGAQSVPMPWSELSRLPCRTFLSVQGTSLFFPAQDALSEHFAQVDKAGAFGSTCNIVDYVTKTCRTRAAGTVGQAVAALLALQRAGRPLPHIGMCGA